MKIRSTVTAALLATALASTAQADQGVSLGTTYTDFTTWTLAGSARAQNTTPGNGFTYSDLILTDVGVGGSAGSGFAPTALTLDFNQAFAFDFHFFIPTNADLRGDGLTFTLATAPGLGYGGSGLGYEGLAGASVAFAVDTFHFDGEAVSPSLQILANGSVTPLAVTETGLGDDIRDDAAHTHDQWYATLAYTPSGLGDNSGLFSGSIAEPNLGSFSVQAAVDFSGLAGAPVFYGFTAGNGLATDGHYVTSAVAVPEPGSWALLLAGLGVAGVIARRRRA